MDLSIIILNYKQKGLVKQCIKGIVSAAPKLNYELIVVDNNSNDYCLKEIEALHATCVQAQNLASVQSEKPPLVTIQAPTNGGFAYGHNIAFKKTKGKYVVVLNPDIAIVPGALEKMFEFMENNLQVGIIGPRLINPDGSIQYSCRRFPSWQMPLYRRTFLGKMPWGKKSLEKYLMQDFNHKETISVDWLFGAFLMIRKDLLEKIGFFDERFFMYFEDLDFCRRCWDSGLEVVYYSDVELVHYHGRLSARRSGIFGIFSKGGQIHIKSGIKYFAKYFGVKLPR